MLKIALVLTVLTVSAWSSERLQYPYTLYKAYPQSINQVQFLKELAISVASNQNPAVFLTPLGAGKTAYVLLPGNSQVNYTAKFERQHIQLRKAEVSNVQRAQFDNSMHQASEFPPRAIRAMSTDSTPSDSYIISSPRVTNWGIWGNWAQCPKGQYVVGMQLKTEPYQGKGDDTALNAIKLLCAAPGSHSYHAIQSLEGQWGTWGRTVYCPNDSQAVGFELRSEAYQGNGDDTAANNLRLYCNSEYAQVVEGDGTSWGTFTGVQVCLRGQAVNGFRTQVEPYQGSGDDTALNNVDMECVDIQK